LRAGTNCRLGLSRSVGERPGGQAETPELGSASPGAWLGRSSVPVEAVDGGSDGSAASGHVEA